jgi:hypothetical protein
MLPNFFHTQHLTITQYATVFSLLVKQDYNCKSQEDLHCFIQRREQLIAFKNQEIAS